MKEVDFEGYVPPPSQQLMPLDYWKRRARGHYDHHHRHQHHKYGSDARFTERPANSGSWRNTSMSSQPMYGGHHGSLRRTMSDCSAAQSGRLHQRPSGRIEMSEGRKAQVLLLDERRLELLIQPKLNTLELLELVSSHFNLKEREYFGLAFKDDAGHNFWLQLDKRVLEHEFPKKTGTLILYFLVRFFVESISYLRDNATIELFYQQAKQAIFKGSIECDADTVFELAAHVLQATHGDFYEEETARKQLKKLPVLPTSTLKEHPSLPYCEERVLGHYRKLEGQTRGASIVNYMTVIESLPTYGIHYYEVKDKSGLPWWLGLSHRGISLYDHSDKRTPRRVFAWKQLENLYFRDKKFSIEVHDPKRIVHTLSSFNLYEDAIHETFEEFDDLTDAISDPTTQVSVSRRTFGPGNVNVHAWFTSSQSLTKCIWSMAVHQHQFYLDHKHSRPQLPQVRSMSEIASDLCRSSTSLHSSSAASGEDGISRSNSAHSLFTGFSTITSNHSAPHLSAEDIEAAKDAQRDMYAALKERQAALEEALRKKTEQLKQLCLKEAELTGELPLEMPLENGDPVPRIQKRRGTEFSISPALLTRNNDQEEEDKLAAKELEYEIQDKIVKAAHKLAQDHTVSRNIRKQRRQSYHRAHSKLKALREELNKYKMHAGKPPIKPASSVEDPDITSPMKTVSPGIHDNRIGQHGNYLDHSSRQAQVDSGSRITGSSSYPEESKPKSAPASPIRQPHKRHMSRATTPSPGPNRHGADPSTSEGYIPNSVYATRTQYRNRMYPTFTNRSNSYTTSPPPHPSEYSGSPLPHDGDYHQTRNHPPHTPHTTVHNLYNVNSHSSSRYDSADELKSPDEQDVDWPSKHGSLESSYRKGDRVRDGSSSGLQYSRSNVENYNPGDYRDSPYRDKTPRNVRGDGYDHLHAVRDGSEQYPRGGSMPPAVMDRSYSPGPGVGPTYSDSSQSSGGNAPQWYQSPEDQRPMHLHPQQPAHASHYDTSQHHISYEGVDLSLVESPTTNSPNPDNTSNSATVTKYQNYVEVSKPFEMADFYKYSEKLRKQRTPDTRSHASPHRLQSPTTPSYRNPSRSNQGQSRSRPASPHSQPDCGDPHMTSPQFASPPSPPYHQQQYGTNTTTPHHAMKSSSTAYSSPAPRHVAYQPPQPMTCEALPQPQPPPQPQSNSSVSSKRMSDLTDSALLGNMGVAGEFSEEMLAWYSNHGDHSIDSQHSSGKSATLV